MYNAALPGEYLELSLPTLPTPPSSTESSSNQFIPTHNTLPDRHNSISEKKILNYLIPRHNSDTHEKVTGITYTTVPPHNNHHPGSPPTNHHPADNPHSDQTIPAVYQNRLFANQGWDTNDTGQFKRRHTFNQETSVSTNAYVRPRNFSEACPNEMQKMPTFKTNQVIYNENVTTSINGTMAMRSYSDSSYVTNTTNITSEKRGSSESGYGTTTRSSVSSDKDRLCYKCRHVSDNDDVFYKEEEEGTEKKVESDCQYR